MSVASPSLDRPLSPDSRAAHPSAPLRRFEAPLVLISSALLLAGPSVLLWPGLLLGLLAWIWCARRWLARPSPLDAGWLVLVAGTLLGFAVSPNGSAALSRLAAVLAALMLFYWLRDRVRSHQALRLATLGLLAVCGVGALVVLALIRGQLPASLLTRVLAPLLGIFAAFPGVSGDVLEVNSRFPVHQYGFAYLLLVMTPFLAAKAVLGSGWTRRTVAGGGVLALATLLAATEARGALVALAVAIALVASLRSRWFWLLLPLGGLGLYLLLARGIISRSLEGAWLETRLSIWTRSLHLLTDYPFSGAGLGMQTFAQVFAWNFDLPNSYEVVHSHNVFIQAYAEQGLLGMVGLMLVLGGSLLCAWLAVRRAPLEGRVAPAGILGALLASVLYGLTDQVPTTNDGYALLAALCALGVAGAGLGRVTGLEAGRSPDRRSGSNLSPTLSLSRSLVLAVVALLFVGVAPRWASGLALNVGAAELAAAALSPAQEADQKRPVLARAESALGAALAWNRQNVAAYRELARVRLLQHDVTGALAALEAARQAGPLDDYERTQLGRLYLKMGYWQPALDLWQAAGQTGLLSQAADDLTSKSDFKGAAAAHAALVELNPEVPENYSNLAKAVLAGPTPKVDEAMQWFGRAAELKPEVRRNLARQLVLQGEDYRTNERRGGGRPELAAFWFGLASQVDPSYDRPEVEMGAVLYYAGRYGEAAEHFRAATARDPQNGSSWHQLGQAEEAAGRQTEAVAAYEQAVRVAPNRAGLRASLGRIYLSLGRCNSARIELDQALRLEPGNATAQEAFARFPECR